jgi:poly-gamma-glutamate capsule biosynthesis protein CapA/YwtB (metallophosphatase superfamily)
MPITDKNIAGLQYIGTNIASVANNHFGNHGIEGMNETVQQLKQANITPVGNAGPVYKNVRGVHLAFLAFNDIGAKEAGINWA